MIASYLAEVLQEEASPTGAQFAYFFCDADDENRKSATTVLRSIIWQLLRSKNYLLKHILPSHEIYGNSTNGGVKIEVGNLWKILKRIFADAELGEVVILIDGLDECDSTSQKELLGRFTDFFLEPKQGKARLLYTSREEEDVKELLPQLNHLRLIPGGEVNTDLSNYIDFKVAELVLRKSYPASLKDQVKKKLRENAEGTFLWVSFVAKELDNIPSRLNYTVPNKLQEFPTKLKDVYFRILSKIVDPGAAQILRFVTAASRPWKVYELTIVNLLMTTLPNDISQEDIELRLNRYEACGSMLYLNDTSMTIHLVHRSVKEYLLDENMPLLAFRIKDNEIKRNLYEICEKFLNGLEWGGSWEVMKRDPLGNRHLQQPFGDPCWSYDGKKFLHDDPWIAMFYNYASHHCMEIQPEAPLTGNAENLDRIIQGKGKIR